LIEDVGKHSGWNSGKEIVVSTMAVLYNQYEVESGNKVILTEQLQKEVYRSDLKQVKLFFLHLWLCRL
jgi:hypothetical protein